MRIVVYAQPSIEPVTVAQAKSHCRIDISDDDTLMATLITSARQVVEGYIQDRLITQTLNVYYDICDEPFGRAFDFYDTTLSRNNYSATAHRMLTLPVKHVISVTSLTSYADDAAATVLSTSAYFVSANRMALNQNYNWPTLLRLVDCVKVILVAGYGPAATDVPGPIKGAILELIAHWYENRSAVFDPMSPAPNQTMMPYGVTAMLAPYCARSL